MLSSKANAALARLKEIEEKYKIKRTEQKWNRKEDTDSSISSVSIIPSENLSTELKGSPRNVSKSKLDIKMPNTRFEERAEETKLSSDSKKSTSDEMSPKRLKNADKINLDVAISPLEDKSSRSSGKQESFISGVTTIQENSSIESVLDDSVISSKSSLSRAKTSQRDLPTVNDKFFKHKERTRAAAGHGAGSKSDKSSEISKGKSSGNSSLSKPSRLSEKSNDKRIFQAHAGTKSRERSFEERATIKIPEAASLNRNSNHSGSSRDNSVIVGKSIGTVEDGSEIISELSRSEGSTAAKIENSINVSKNSKYPISEGTPVTISNSSKHSVVQNGYANDTFEDISSSPMRSKSASQREMMIDEKKETFDPAGFNAKKIDIAPQKEHGSYQSSARSRRGCQKASRDGQTIGTVAPKPSATEIKLESSTYVSDFESTNTNPDNATMRLIKLSKFTNTRSEKQRKPHQRRMKSFEGDVRNAASSDKNISNSSDTGDMTKMEGKINSSEMAFVWQESGRKTSNRTKERAVIDVTESPRADDEDRIESAKSNLSVEENEEGKKDVFENRRIAQDPEIVLRKLHRDATDALAKRHASSKITERPSDGKTEPEIRDTTRTRKMRRENKNYRSSERNEAFDHNDRERNTDRKKKRDKIVNSKSAEARSSTRSRKEDKTLRFDKKQMRGLRKRIIELRLQQERENLQKYLYEQKDLRPESSSILQSYFSPLEFPKIAEFAQPDTIDLESKPGDHCVVHRERVSTIRRWLKDQYILYRDYCTMAQAINAHYVPTTLEDAKKTIRELRKTRIKTR